LLKLLLLPILTLVIGVGAGLGAGYAGLNPQVNELAMRVESIDDLQEQTRKANAEVDSLLLRNSDLEVELEAARAQLQDLDLLREQLDALRAPDVQLFGEIITEELVENGRSVGYTLSLNLMNFGLENARNVEVTVTWVQLTVCGCDSEPGHVEVIALEFLPGQTLEELNMMYFFKLDRDFVSVHAGVDWAQ